MAANTVMIVQQIARPIRLLKWKVREGCPVAIGQVVLLYEMEAVGRRDHRRLKSQRAGIVSRLVAEEGAVVAHGDNLFELEPCIHPTVMKDMCAECGADLRKEEINCTASVPMIHAVPELKVSKELAEKLGRADGERLLRDKKLVLLVDLDQTLIHTTNDIIPPNLKDVYHFQLYGPNSPWYHTRLRPGTHDFLANVANCFELHICTFGARNYAHRITAILDADGQFFCNRVLSRDECFNPTSKTANLKALFPCGDHMVCIIDDREDVWSYAANLIHVKPYHFFQHTGDIHAPPGLEKHENDDKEGLDLSKYIAEDGEKNGPSEDADDANKPIETETEIASPNENGDERMEESGENVTETTPDPPCDTAEKCNGVNKSNNVTSELEIKDKGGGDAAEEQKNANSSTHLTDGSDSINETSDDGGAPLNATTSAIKPQKNNKIPDTISALNSSLNLIEVEDPDDYLLYLEDILKRIHRAFYEEYDQMESGAVPDLKVVIPRVKNQVLKGMQLVFSGLVPTHIKLRESRAYQVARSLGAQVTQDLDANSTHLVAVRPGTAKVNAGRKHKGVRIVTPDWLWACAERWEHVDEMMFPLSNKRARNRHPPPHCSSPEHVPEYAVHSAPAVRKRSPSGRFMDTINPLMSFSRDDIADMDKEVEDILDAESESEDEESSTTPEELQRVPPLVDDKLDMDSSSSSEESLTGEFPKGYKRHREQLEQQQQENDDRDQQELAEERAKESEDEYPSAKFRRGEVLDSDLDIGQESNSEGSVEAPDEIDDGEWNMMGAALEREFLSNS